MEIPFRLFATPILVQRHIIYQMDLVDVIGLTLVSNFFKKNLHCNKIPVDSLTFHLSTSYYIKIKNQKVKNSIQVPLETCESIKLSPCKVDGIAVKYSLQRIDRLGNYFSVEGNNQEEIFERITKHLLSFLNVQKFNLITEMFLDLPKLCIWNYARDFNKLEICTANLDFCLGPLSLSARKIHLNTCRKGEESSRRVNTVLKQWIKGEREALEVFQISHARIDQNEVFNGITIKETEFSKEQPNGVIYSFAGAGFDIQRESDGAQATVVTSPTSVFMFAWNEKPLRKVMDLDLTMLWFELE